MLRRYGPWAMAALMGAGGALGQEPIPASSLAPASMPGVGLNGPVPMTMQGVSHDPHGPGWLRQRALTDPLGANAELRGLRQEANPFNEPECEAPGARYGFGRHGGGAGLLGRGRRRGHGGDPDAGAAADFQVANPWAFTNVEKKLYVLYQYHAPYASATKLAYGHSNGMSVGMEVLPWVIRDDDKHFTRFGLNTAFDYRDFGGNINAVLRSELSGNTLASAGGRSLGALIGGTWRSDMYFFGIRMSPSVTCGINLDWVSMRQTPVDPAVLASVNASTQRPPNETPTVQPQVLGGPNFPWLTPQSSLPLNPPGAAPLYVVQSFKNTDFAVGGYFRTMFDFPLREHLNLGFGFDARMLPGKAFLRDGDFRKHVGVLFQIGGDF